MIDIVRTTFASASLRRLLLGACGTSAGQWAFTLLVSVHVYREGGAAAVGISMLVRELPAGLLTPWMAVLADRRSRRQVLVQSGAAQAVLVAATAGLVAADASLVLVLLLASLVAIASAPSRPAQIALVGGLASTPTQIAAANVAWGGVESAGFLLGSVAAATLISPLGMATALLVSAAPLAIGTALHALLPADAPAEGIEETSTWQELVVGLRSIAEHGELRLLTGLRGGAALVEGVVDVLLVVCALELLAAGDGAVGVLNAGWGIGGLLGGWVALWLLGRGRLASGIALGCLLVGVPFALVAAWASTLWAVVLLVGVGIGFAVLETAMTTLTQRQASDTILARVFGVHESLQVLGVALGGLVAAGLVAVAGVRGAVVLTAVALPLLALARRRALAQLEAATAAPEDAFALLRGLDVFAPLPIATIETLATRSTFVDVAAGTAVVRQGDPGHELYVIETGRFHVIADGRTVDSALPGECFGEVALLRDQPRNATVEAVQDARLLVLDRADFLLAVGAHEHSARAAGRLADEREARAAGELPARMR